MMPIQDSSQHTSVRENNNLKLNQWFKVIEADANRLWINKNRLELLELHLGQEDAFQVRDAWIGYTLEWIYDHLRWGTDCEEVQVEYKNYVRRFRKAVKAAEKRARPQVNSAAQPVAQLAC